MNQKFHPEQIRKLLNRSLAQIDGPTLARLRDARTQALARYDARSTAPTFALAGHLTRSGHGTHSHHKSYYWAAAILLVACLFSGAAYWQHATTEHDTSDVDIAILTDDLPMHVYVD